MSISSVNLSTSLSVSQYSAPAQPSAPAPQAPAASNVPAPAARPVHGDSDAYLEKVNNHVNDALKASEAEFEFRIHKGDDRVIIRLVDSSTHEVLREIPSEKYLDMVDQLSKLAGKLVGMHTDVTL
jgi:flagellar protein FlaG